MDFVSLIESLVLVSIEKNLIIGIIRVRVDASIYVKFTS